MVTEERGEVLCGVSYNAPCCRKVWINNIMPHHHMKRFFLLNVSDLLLEDTQSAMTKVKLKSIISV